MTEGRTGLKISLENRTVNILNHIHAGVLYCKNDQHSTILYANDYFYKMIGYEKDEFAILFGNRFADLVVDDVSHILKSIDAKIAKGEDLDYEYRMINKQGEIFWVHDTAKYEKEYDCWYVTLMNITNMKSIEYERERFEFYLNSMPNKIVICDQNAKIVYKNKCANECEYYEKDATSLHQLVGGTILGKQMDSILSQAADGEIVTYETRVKERQTFRGHDRNSMIPIKNREGHIVNYMQVSEDLLTINDGLTHFPTRAMFEHYCNNFIKEYPNSTVYMAIIDIDDFKGLNDVYGHHMGDEVIRKMGHKLISVLEREDYVCRFGGDEFLVLFINQTKESVIEKCQYILNTKMKSTKEKEEMVDITCSIGVVYGNDAIDYQDLLEKADRALYKVKEQGKSGLLFYENKER